jgi:hypothetical protein
MELWFQPVARQPVHTGENRRSGAVAALSAP